MSNTQLSILFFLQLAFILAACRIVGMIAKYFGQPQVVAEMIAGVLLGPSLFGLFWPEAQSMILPKASMGIIYAVSQVGLVLYMFLIGVEFEVGLIRQRLRSAAAVSLSGILAPFILGGVLALFMAGDPTFFTSGVAGWEAVLFMGSAMSITAFPMLARIIHECGLTKTSLGTLALAAGSMDDAAAWCFLAIVVSSFGGNASLAITAIGGGALYAAVVLLIGKPLLRRLGEIAERNNRVDERMLSFVLMLVALAAWFTDVVGIYAVFGAFILGTAMPRGRFAHDVLQSLEPVTKNLLLPLFFVYSGLNTRIGLINTPYLLAISLVVLLVACFGKGVACWLAARWQGEPQREALAIGALMNARGLMELILLNIGLERGIITPTLFTVMVMMAILTTLAASPIFNWVYYRRFRPVTAQPVADPA